MQILESLTLNLWIGQIEAFHRLGHRAGDHQPGEPFIVRGHDVPRRLIAAGFLNQFFIGIHVSWPQLALGHITHGKFPPFARLIDALEKALALFLQRHIEKEFQNQCAVARQMPLEGADIVEAVLPDFLAGNRVRQSLARQVFAMHADGQHFLVVRTIENADTAALGQRLADAPEKIVVEFFLARRLERMNLHALRIDAAHDVLDDAVLAGGIHGLKHQQHRPFVVGVEFFLQFREPLDALAEQRLGVLLVDRQAAAFGRVMIGQTELARFVDAKLFGEFGELHEMFS